MWYIAALVGLIIAGAVTGIAKAKGIFLLEDISQAVTIDSIRMRSLSTSQINLLLARLEKEEPPGPVIGAMCYDPASAPLVAEYVCPVCGEKTVYEDHHTEFVEWELQGARRLAESINGNTEFTVQLDETLFCGYCSSETDADPSLLLRVVHSDGEVVLNRISLDDLRKLESFLQGRLYWITYYDEHKPLQDEIERLQTLLGIEEEL